MKLFKTLVILFILSNYNLFAQWQSDQRLTNFTNNSYTSFNNAWCVASSGNEVHAVCYDNRNDPVNYEIYYKRSSDSGSSWGADIRLTNSSGESQSPSVTVSGSVVHVVWQERRDGNDEIYYKRSLNGGVSWGADIRLTNNSLESWLPSVSVAGALVQIVWQERRDGNDEIYSKRSADGGDNWGADTRLTNNSAISGHPSVAVSGMNVNVVWDDFRNGNYEIYNKRSSDGGVSWGLDTRLTNNSAVSNFPSVSVSGSIVHVSWQERRDGNYEIYYKSSADSGINWGADTRLTNNSASSWYPSLSVSGSVVHLVWQENRDGNYEIYYKQSTDDGINWNSDIRLTTNTSESWNPSVSVSGSAVHVVWYDYRHGYPEMYYKRDPSGNPSSSFLTLNLTAFIQGFYNSVSNSMISDTARIFLRNASSPYNVIDSSNGILSSSGTGTFLFSNAINGVNYYIEVKHRNSIQTWSSSPVTFISGFSSYTFIALQSQAYGNNVVQVDTSPVQFANYSGDINQDETIDASDVSEVDNDAYNSLSGYVRTDVTGDDFVDAADVSIVDNNAFNSVSVVIP